MTHPDDRSRHAGAPAPLAARVLTAHGGAVDPSVSGRDPARSGPRTAEQRLRVQRDVPVVQHVRYLQRRAGWSHAAEQQRQEHLRNRRVQVLALVTTILWLAALLVLLRSA